MNTTFRKVLNDLGTVHYLGWFPAFFYFSYLYVQENGFLSWLLFGEVKPALKAVVWEVFLVLALIQTPTHEPAVSAIREIWWQAEYPVLLRAVARAPNSLLSTSYRTGPSGRGMLKVVFFKENEGGLFVTIELPKEAYVVVDPTTGEKNPIETSPRITIRDHDLDGLPDDFSLEPGGKPLYEEEFTKDGFVKFRNSSEHEAILMQWSVALGYGVNHFLHGIDSAMPRE